MPGRADGIREFDMINVPGLHHELTLVTHAANVATLVVDLSQVTSSTPPPSMSLVAARQDLACAGANTSVVATGAVFRMLTSTV